MSPKDEDRTAQDKGDQDQDAQDQGAVEADPVRQYYADKKKRYLAKMREAAQDMQTGTPFDWEDAERYRADDDER